MAHDLLLIGDPDYSDISAYARRLRSAGLDRQERRYLMSKPREELEHALAHPARLRRDVHDYRARNARESRNLTLLLAGVTASGTWGWGSLAAYDSPVQPLCAVVAGGFFIVSGLGALAFARAYVDDRRRLAVPVRA